MSSTRSKPFRPKPPQDWDERVAVMQSTPMFLLQKTGPTRFVVRGETDQKFAVHLGSTCGCTCLSSHDELCVHLLFVTIKVLKVQHDNPISWQVSLIDSEINKILQEGGSRREHQLRQRKFLRKGSGHTAAAGRNNSNNSSEPDVADSDDVLTNEAGQVPRLELVPDEVCPICQEEMREGMALTYCRRGCGNNMHVKCMLLYAEHRRESKSKVTCCLCRVDWGPMAVHDLQAEKKEAVQASKPQHPALPISCYNCTSTIPAGNPFYRCLHCCNARNGGAASRPRDLCKHCHSVLSAASKCVSSDHMFVQGTSGCDPPTWTPADPAGRRGAGPPVSAELLSVLQGRELTTADYSLLLQLDNRATPPLHEHLVKSMPSAATGGDFISTQRELEVSTQQILSTNTMGDTQADSIHIHTHTNDIHTHAEDNEESDTAPVVSLTETANTCTCVCCEGTIHANNLSAARLLPCGHVAHEACVVGMILEVAGGTEGIENCRCPKEGTALFPFLSLRRKKPRRRRSSSAAEISGNGPQNDVGTVNIFHPPLLPSGQRGERRPMHGLRGVSLQALDPAGDGMLVSGICGMAISGNSNIENKNIESRIKSKDRVHKHDTRMRYRARSSSAPMLNVPNLMESGPQVLPALPVPARTAEPRFRTHLPPVPPTTSFNITTNLSNTVANTNENHSTSEVVPAGRLQLSVTGREGLLATALMSGMTSDGASDSAERSDPLAASQRMLGRRKIRTGRASLPNLATSASASGKTDSDCGFIRGQSLRSTRKWRLVPSTRTVVPLTSCDSADSGPTAFSDTNTLIRTHPSNKTIAFGSTTRAGGDGLSIAAMSRLKGRASSGHLSGVGLGLGGALIASSIRAPSHT